MLVPGFVSNLTVPGFERLYKPSDLRQSFGTKPKWALRKMIFSHFLSIICPATPHSLHPRETFSQETVPKRGHIHPNQRLASQPPPPIGHFPWESLAENMDLSPSRARRRPRGTAPCERLQGRPPTKLFRLCGIDSACTGACLPSSTWASVLIRAPPNATLPETGPAQPVRVARIRERKTPFAWAGACRMQQKLTSP